MEKIGYDIGGVIMGGRGDAKAGKDTSFFGDNWLETPETKDASHVIADLVRLRFPKEDSFIVSKCGKKTQEKTLRWFDHTRFFERTGLDPANVHFCRERHQKTDICKELGITTFIDDRLEVLGYMIGTVPTLLLFDPDPAEAARFRRHHHSVIEVSSWSEVRQTILE